LGLPVLAHLAQTEAEQIVGGVEEAVVRELGEQPLVERDRRRVVDARRRGVGRVRTLQRLLVSLVGVQVLLGRFLVIQLGQPEHGVQRLSLGYFCKKASNMAMASRRRSRASRSFMAICGSYLALTSLILSR